MTPMLVYLSSFCLAALLLAVDQWSKFWAENNMTLDDVRPLLPPVLELHLVHNTGAAWSIFSGARWLLIGVTSVMILAVALVLITRIVRHPLGIFAGFLILSGGIGNLVDRIGQGYVVDMLRFPFWTSYPTFNVADMCVVAGCVLWLLYVLFVREDSARSRKEPETAEPAGASVTEAYNPYAQGTPYHNYALDEAERNIPEQERRESTWTNIPPEVEKQALENLGYEEPEP